MRISDWTIDWTGVTAYRLPSELNGLTLDSSLYTTFRHLFRFHCKYVFAKVIRFLISKFDTHGTCRASLPYSSFDIKRLCTVLALTSNDKSRLIWTDVSSGWRLEYIIILCFILGVFIFYSFSCPHVRFFCQCVMVIDGEEHCRISRIYS